MIVSNLILSTITPYNFSLDANSYNTNSSSPQTPQLSHNLGRHLAGTPPVDVLLMHRSLPFLTQVPGKAAARLFCGCYTAKLDFITIQSRRIRHSITFTRT